MAKYKNITLDETTDILKALADRNRLRIVMALLHGELCVCRIVELVRLAPSTVSKHLSILRQAGLIHSRKKGRWIYYKLAPRTANAAAQKAVRWLRKALALAPAIIQDQKLLKKILKQDPEQLCLKIKKR